MALDYAFTGGANADPADKSGVANMVASLLDEGAGELDARAFQERMEEKAIQLGFTAGVTSSAAPCVRCRSISTTPSNCCASR